MAPRAAGCDSRAAETATAALKHVLIGTAGHIDHGKTRLVGRLTGVDTDRLPEEKARGISIDLGFAHWEGEGYRFGVVDVPGHERFVKNMVAGAAGVNLALLVVAADDGVMPQTREHLEIMDLLGVKSGVVAITKIDLVDAEMLLLVQEELAQLVAGTFLDDAALVRVSSETGEGVGELKRALERAARQIEWPATGGPFRMPVDRVFSLAGRGTIVTGSVLGGEVHPGDTLELLPDQREVRVRGVQNYGVDAGDSSARQRTALNLAGIKTEEIERGDELATPGYMRPTRRVVVALKNLNSSNVTLKDRMELTLHLGTCEVLARLILKGARLGPGDEWPAELRTKRPIVAAYGQRYILRRISPAVTVGGGTILDPFIAPRRRVKDLAAYTDCMQSPIETERLSFLFSQQNVVSDSPLEAAWRAGVDVDRYWDLIGRLKSDGALEPLRDASKPLLIHRDRLATLRAAVLRTVRAEVARRQPRRSLPRNTLATACQSIASPEVVDAIFELLVSSGELAAAGSNLGPADLQVQLTKNQRQLLEQILPALREAGLSPPTSKELADRFREKRGEIEALLNLLAEDGHVAAVADGLYFGTDALEQARAMCASALAGGREATLSELRSVWNTSRKYAVPLAEYFDRQGVTERKGDVRRAGPSCWSDGP